MRNILTRRRLFLGLAPAALMVAPDYSVAMAKPEDKWNVRSYGARGNGIDLDNEAIMRTIEACAGSGGGTVLFPAGTYLTGTIVLKDRVVLELEAGAVILGSKELRHYPSHTASFSSHSQTYTERSLIYAEGAQEIGIRGIGVIDGQGAAFHGADKVRPFLMRFNSCRNVRITDITLRNSAMWIQHYLDCEDVVISGITVNSRVAWNNDGIDIDCCRQVRISDCNIISGDDAICLKTSAAHPCRDIVIDNCVVSSSSNAFKIGTETIGGFENVAISNCSVYDTKMAGIALEMVDGGDLNGVSISNIVMRGVAVPIFIRLGDRAIQWPENSVRPPVGRLRNVSIENIQATALTNAGCVISGLPGHPLENVSLSKLRLTFPGGGNASDAYHVPAENADKYPEFDMFGILPAYGLYCRHGKGLVLRDIHTVLLQVDERPSIVCEDLDGLEVSGAMLDNASENEPSLRLIEVKRVLIQGCRIHDKLQTWLEVQGSGSEHISVIGNDLANANAAINLDDSVAKSAIFLAANRT